MSKTLGCQVLSDDGSGTLELCDGVNAAQLAPITGKPDAYYSISYEYTGGNHYQDNSAIFLLRCS